MKYLILMFGLICGSAVFMLCGTETAFGQNEKTSAQMNPPKLIRYTRPKRKKAQIPAKSSAGAKSKRKKTKLRRKIDSSKVPQLIRPAN